MQSFAPLRPLAGLALLAALTCSNSIAQDQQDKQDGSNNREIKHVFVIAMENHNWTQPATVTGGIQQIYQNPNAPFINSLVNGTALGFINGRQVNISQQRLVRHVLSQRSGHPERKQSAHPSV